MNRLLVLGGTADGRLLARRLADGGYAVTLRVATEHGLALAGAMQEEPAPAGQTWGSLGFSQGRLDQAGLEGLLREGDFAALVDASHPYAILVSRNARAACAATGRHYIRYERPTSIGAADAGACEPAVIMVPDHAAALERVQDLPGRVFLATGANQAELWVYGLADPGRLVIRVLPVPDVVARCQALGIRADRIIAMQGPFSQAMNREHFLWARADILVTKDGGREGGTGEKLAAAADLGLTIIVIGRPVPTPDGLSTAEQVLKRIEQALAGAIR